MRESSNENFWSRIFFGTFITLIFAFTIAFCVDRASATKIDEVDGRVVELYHKDSWDECQINQQWNGTSYVQVPTFIHHDEEFHVNWEVSYKDKVYIYHSVWSNGYHGWTQGMLARFGIYRGGLFKHIFVSPV